MTERKDYDTDDICDEYSMLVFNANGNYENTKHLAHQFSIFGYTKVQNTGIKDYTELLKYWFPNLGFNDKTKFIKGGMTSYEKRWIDDNYLLRRLDYYPSEYDLLPNNEVQYQSYTPKNVLLYCNDIDIDKSYSLGRTFIHSAVKLEEYIYNSGEIGINMLNKFRKLGMIYEFGFLNKTNKEGNYGIAWQDLFRTDCIETALKPDDRFDKKWKKDDIIMTQTKIPIFVKHPEDNNEYMRFPRIAKTEPEKINGYRRYIYGDGSELSQEEKNLLIDAYYKTREGIEWKKGEFILFDNIKYAHSKEAYKGKLELFVGMSHGLFATDDYQTQKAYIPYYTVKPYVKRYSKPEDARYKTPDCEFMWNEVMCMRIFDCKNDITDKRIKCIRNEFDKYGSLQLINTGLTELNRNIFFEKMQFTKENKFIWGGRTSGRTVRDSLDKYLQSVDYYPKELVLLPHNEILYQKEIPSELLFHCIESDGIKKGGRTFVHDAQLALDMLNRTTVGKLLVNKIKKHGFKLITGFLDEKHPEKKYNYFRSWQDRFGTTDIKKAIEICNESKDQFDECWIKYDKGYSILMTSVTVDGFRDDFLMFPRIGLDGPMLHNGFRKYLIGEKELTTEEMQLLLNVYWITRQGRYYEKGDILLVNNISHGHSRESYDCKRKIGVIMKK